jgi:hypothetical protein
MSGLEAGLDLESGWTGRPPNQSALVSAISLVAYPHSAHLKEVPGPLCDPRIERSPTPGGGRTGLEPARATFVRSEPRRSGVRYWYRWSLTPEQTIPTQAPPSRGGSAEPRDSTGVRRVAVGLPLLQSLFSDQ